LCGVDGFYRKGRTAAARGTAKSSSGVQSPRFVTVEIGELTHDGFAEAEKGDEVGFSDVVADVGGLQAWVIEYINHHVSEI